MTLYGVNFHLQYYGKKIQEKKIYFLRNIPFVKHNETVENQGTGIRLSVMRQERAFQHCFHFTVSSITEK